MIRLVQSKRDSFVQPKVNNVFRSLAQFNLYICVYLYAARSLLRKTETGCILHTAYG